MSEAAEVHGFAPRPRAGEPDASTQVFDVHVPRELVYFRGHFAGDPILAAVVQIEVLVLRQIATSWPHHTRLHRLVKLRFRKPIRPGDDLELRLERAAWSVRFELRRDGEPCSSGIAEFLEPGAPAPLEPAADPEAQSQAESEAARATGERS